MIKLIIDECWPLLLIVSLLSVAACESRAQATVRMATEDYVTNRVAIATNLLEKVAHTGEYSDLKNLPPLPPTPQAMTNIAETVTGVATGKLATVAHTGDYEDLTNVPEIPDPEEKDLRAWRLYHYGDPDIVESPAEWFQFDAATGTITGFVYQAGREEVVIPWAIGGIAVTSLGDSLFFGSGPIPISGVMVPKSVTSIGSYAFMQVNISTLSLPGVTSIGDLAFMGADIITLNFSGDFPSMSPNAFAGSNPDLKIYVDNPAATGWPADVEGVPVVRLPLHTDALTLGGVTRSTWPEGGGEEEDPIFQAASNAIWQAIAARLESEVDPVFQAESNAIWQAIAAAAESGSSSNALELAALRIYHYGSPDVVESPEEWFTLDPVLRKITAYHYAPGRDQVVVPWAIGSVPVEAIATDALDNEEFPAYGSPIARLILPRTISSFPTGQFMYKAIAHLVAPGVTNIGTMAFAQSFLTRVELPALTHAGLAAFANMPYLEQITLPALTHLEGSAFTSCPLLERVDLPNLTSVPQNTFDSCEALVEAAIPAATSIGTNAFSGCESLGSISLPSVSHIATWAFLGCYALTNITFSGPPPTVEEHPWDASVGQLKLYVDAPLVAAGWPAEIHSAPVVRPSLHTDELVLGGVGRSIWPDTTAAPEWIGFTNWTHTVTVTNATERPVYALLAGNVSVSFAALRPPVPLYLVLAGADSVTFPGATILGGGSWQAGRDNHFIVWGYGTNAIVQPVVATGGGD